MLLILTSCEKEEESTSTDTTDTDTTVTENVSVSQQMLNNGETPFDVYQSGVSLDSIYGLSYEGGLITYLDTTSGVGLVAAPFDMGPIEWGCESTTIGAFGTAIGTGAQNTIDILAGCSNKGTAAYLCDSLTIDGFSDWYLPSKDELNVLYTNLYLNGFGGFIAPYYFNGFTGSYYWSSSEQDHNDVWAQNFNDGFQIDDDFRKSFGSDSKYTDSYVYVRAVRTF